MRATIAGASPTSMAANTVLKRDCVKARSPLAQRWAHIKGD